MTFWAFDSSGGFHRTIRAIRRSRSAPTSPWSRREARRSASSFFFIPEAVAASIRATTSGRAARASSTAFSWAAISVLLTGLSTRRRGVCWREEEATSHWTPTTSPSRSTSFAPMASRSIQT